MIFKIFVFVGAYYHQFYTKIEIIFDFFVGWLVCFVCGNMFWSTSHEAL